MPEQSRTKYAVCTYVRMPFSRAFYKALPIYFGKKNMPGFCFSNTPPTVDIRSPAWFLYTPAQDMIVDRYPDSVQSLSKHK